MTVRAKFAYWAPPWHDIKPDPSYIVVESDNPNLPLYGNVCGEQLLQEGVPLPLTPSYETWVQKGSPVFRGK